MGPSDYDSVFSMYHHKFDGVWPHKFQCGDQFKEFTTYPTQSGQHFAGSLQSITCLPCWTVPPGALWCSLCSPYCGVAPMTGSASPLRGCWWCWIWMRRCYTPRYWRMTPGSGWRIHDFGSRRSILRPRGRDWSWVWRRRSHYLSHFGLEPKNLFRGWRSKRRWRLQSTRQELSNMRVRVLSCLEAWHPKTRILFSDGCKHRSENGWVMTYS